MDMVNPGTDAYTISQLHIHAHRPTVHSLVTAHHYQLCTFYEWLIKITER